MGTDREIKAVACNRKIGEKPELSWIDVDLIDVDSNYQREIDPRRVEKILRTFHWDRFGAVVLARQAGGRFTVTDGQHRVKAAQVHPLVTQVPATIISVTGMQEEAANFLVINRDRKGVTTIERYWAGLAAGDATTMRVRDALHSVGCDIAPDQGVYKPNLTNAVSAISRALEHYGDGALKRAIKIIRATWPDDAKCLRGVLITAISRLVEGNRDINDSRLIEVLKRKSFIELTAHAESFRKLSGGSADTALARTITELYNRGLSVNQIYFGAAA